MTTRGLVLGKFLPPHAGHVHLCEVAARMCDELVVAVGWLAREPIAARLRVAWMRELMPQARVVAIPDLDAAPTEELPQLPKDDPAFWPKWTAALSVAGPYDRVFTSDGYGEQLARELGATWIPVDPQRATFPISGTAVRADPQAAWPFLPRCVRAYYARRISVFGPESTGKTTLADRLAHRLDTLCVPEFARSYLEAHRGDLARAALDVIAAGQAALEDALARDATRTLVCDTDPLLTVVWAETLFGPAPALRAAAVARHYDLTLLCDVDLPWVADPVRNLPGDRAAFFARCEAELRAAGRRYVDRARRPRRGARARRDPRGAPRMTWWAVLYDDALAGRPAGARRRPGRYDDAVPRRRAGAAPGRPRVRPVLRHRPTRGPARAGWGARVTGRRRASRALRRARPRRRARGRRHDRARPRRRVRVRARAVQRRVQLVDQLRLPARRRRRNLRMLQRAFEAVVPGGRFALDFLNVPGVLAQFRPHEVTRASGIELVRESRLSDLARGLLHKTWKLALADGTRVERPSTLRLYAPDRLAELFARAGFANVTLHGGIDRSELTLDSPRCIVVGTRP